MAWVICSTSWSRICPAYPIDEEEEDRLSASPSWDGPDVGAACFNALVGQERSIVSEMCRHDAYPIDIQLTYDGQRIPRSSTPLAFAPQCAEQGIEQYSVCGACAPSISRRRGPAAHRR